MAHSFSLISHWQVEATIGEVADILGEAERFPDWWSDVYLSVRIIAPGGPEGVGRTAEVHSRGRLPYTLHWRGKVVESDRPHRWVIKAEGDLAGRGVWTLTQRGRMAGIAYNWQVNVDKPWMRRWLWLLKPVFAWNHRWAMARGLEGLKGELVRRRLLKSRE